MSLEIERKFLVNKTLWDKVKPNSGIRIVQGYLLNTPEKTVRVRVKGNQGFLTIKGETIGISRKEYEYEIPIEDAEEMLLVFCTKRIDKIRYEIKVKGHLWEVDEFKEPDSTLILAEIELNSEDEQFFLPEWITEEVSGDSRYYNANML